MKRKRQGRDIGESSALELEFLLETAAAKGLMSQVTPADGPFFRVPMLITPHTQYLFQVLMQILPGVYAGACPLFNHMGEA